MKYTLPGRLALCLLLAGFGRAAALPIALDATVAVNAEAQVDPAPLQYSRDTISQSESLDELSDAASAMAQTPAGTASASTSVDASWDNPGSGRVEFGATGFATAADGATGRVGVSGTRWTYRFQTAGTSQLSLGYAVDVSPETTDPTGLEGFRFVVVKNGYKPVFDQVLAPGDANAIEVPLEAGATYTVSLIARAGLEGDLGTRTAAMTAAFAWEISEGQ